MPPQKPTPTPHLLHHPTLGCTLRGKHSTSTSTTQFRNLKYASIPARWQPSTPNPPLPPPTTTTPTSISDATHFGPSCPQKRGAQAWDLGLLGESAHLACEPGQGPDEQMNEFECLHVNVTVPSSTIEARSQPTKTPAQPLLPVFVWIHGGGLSMGSNSWPQYDLARLVGRGVARGRPFVGVGVNYRVGILGFAASVEMGIRGNLGFGDLGLALGWVRGHIEGFGGDPRDVSVAGESAGGIAVSTLLCAAGVGRGLFERAVVMSGEVTLRRPMGGRGQQGMFWEQVRFLGLEGVGREERRERLWGMGAEEMVGRLPLAQHFCGLVDGEWLEEDVSLGALADGTKAVHKPGWCKEFVIGDTAHDGTVLKQRILDDPQVLSRLTAACAQTLTPSETQSLISAYNLTPPSSSTPTPQEAQTQYNNLLALASELRFYAPALAAYRGWKASPTVKHAHRYHFHIPNPFPGAFQGLASHEFDVACLLGNFGDEVLGEKTANAAREMQDWFIGFLNGEGWGEDGRVVVFGERGVETMSEEEYDARFRDGRGKLLESIGWDRVWALAQRWQGLVVRDEVQSNL